MTPGLNPCQKAIRFDTDIYADHYSWILLYRYHNNRVAKYMASSNMTNIHVLSDREL